jgi:hypothetical protein
VGRNRGHPWGDLVAASGEKRWPPTGRFPWPPSIPPGVAAVGADRSQTSRGRRVRRRCLKKAAARCLRCCSIQGALSAPFRSCSYGIRSRAGMCDDCERQERGIADDSSLHTADRTRGRACGGCGRQRFGCCLAALASRSGRRVGRRSRLQPVGGSSLALAALAAERHIEPDVVPRGPSARPGLVPRPKQHTRSCDHDHVCGASGSLLDAFCPQQLLLDA